MPIINGIFTKDFPDLGRDVLDTDLVVIAIAGNQITYKTTVGALRDGLSVVVTDSFDGDGNYDATGDGLPDYPTFQVYQSGESILATYNNTTKIISGGTPGAFVATFR